MRGIFSQTVMFARLKRRGLRHVRSGVDGALGLLYPRLWNGSTPFAQLLTLDFYSIGNSCRARKDKRLHLVGVNGPARNCRHHIGRDAGVDRKAPVSCRDDSFIRDHCGADKLGPIPVGNDVSGDIRLREFIRIDKDPSVRLLAIFRNRLVRRERSPADVMVASPPNYPGWGPLRSGFPRPT